MIISASRHTASASGPILAPTDAYAETGKPLPSPAPFSIITVWPPEISDSAPAGTSATRFSFVFISFGTPIFISDVVALKVQRRALRGGPRTEADERLSPGYLIGSANVCDRCCVDRIDQSEQLVQGPV